MIIAPAWLIVIYHIGASSMVMQPGVDGLTYYESREQCVLAGNEIVRQDDYLRYVCLPVGQVERSDG